MFREWDLRQILVAKHRFQRETMQEAAAAAAVTEESLQQERCALLERTWV